MKSVVVVIAVLSVLGLGSYLAAVVLADRAFDELLEISQEIESEKTYGERLAYLGEGGCPLFEGLNQLSQWDQTVVVSRAFTEVDSELSAELLVGIAELENLWIPPWAGSVVAARGALVAHEQAWVELLDDEMRLASRMLNERSLDNRENMWRELVSLYGLATPLLDATFETAERRFLEAADSEVEEQRISEVFAGIDPVCLFYRQSLDRWGP